MMSARTYSTPMEDCMTRLTVVVLAVVLAGCGRAVPPQQATPPSAPTTDTLHALVLQQPTGDGAVVLTRTVSYEQPYRGAKWDRRERFESSGTIRTKDTLGEWTFGYTKTDLNTPRLEIFGLHALSIAVRNTTNGTVEVEWTRSAIVDPNGQTHPVIHRGVKLADRGQGSAPSIIPAGANLNDFVFPASGINFEPLRGSSYWSAPALIERITPGMTLTLVLGMRTESGPASKTFRFAARPR